MEWPFRRPIRHNLAEISSSANLIVRLEDENGQAGFGEGIPRPYVTGETIAAATTALRQSLVPLLLGQTIPAESALGFISGVCPEKDLDLVPAATCALEIALWDLAGRHLGQPAAHLLGTPTRDSLIYSGVIPITSPDELPGLLAMIKPWQFTEMKLKVGTRHDREITALIRQSLGQGIRLRVDANAAWTADYAVEQIHRLAPYHIEAVEQPVAKDDLKGLAQVTHRIDSLVIADESICTRTDATRLVEAGAVGAFNLRLSKCGGPWRTQRLLTLARNAGVKTMLGCQVGELGMLSAAGRHFAVVNPDLLYLEGCLTRFIMDGDIITTDLTFGPGGLARPITKPGLGIEVQEKLLEASLLFSLP